MQVQFFSRREAQTRVVENLPLHAAWQSGSPILWRFDAVWRACAEDGGVPGRDAIDPAVIADVMPYLMLVDVVRYGDGTVEFRSRLVGQQHVGIDGRGGAGETLFRNPDETDEMVDVVETGQPRYARCRVEHMGDGAIEYERATFPLSSDGIEIDRLAVVLVPRVQSSRSRLHAFFSWI